MPISSGSVIVNPKPWWKPSRAKLACETGLRRCDAEIREAGHTKSAAHCGALDGAHHWLALREQVEGGVVEVTRAAVGVRGRDLAAPAAVGTELGASAEVLALRAQDACAASVLFVKVAECCDEAVDQFEVEEVVRRSLDLHHRHVVIGSG